MQIFLGLGTNLGNREMNLVAARDFLMKHDVLVVGQSEVRETAPLGGLDQPNYLNQVIECRTELKPEELMKICKLVEKEMGRPVDLPQLGNVRWKSRIIDIDILFYGPLVIETPTLTIPHPGIYDRDFVIEGLCDLAPEFEHPKLKPKQ